MGTFFLGVLASVVAALFLSLMAYLLGFGRASLKDARYAWQVTRRLRRNGILNFFANRSEYVKHRKNGTIRDYLRTAEHSISYVGFWLAHGVEISNIGHELASLAKEGKFVEVVLLNPKSELIPALSTYLNLPEPSVVKRINDALSHLQQARDSLPADHAHLFRLKLHSQLLTASAFLLDTNKPGAKVLVDFKLFGSDRDNTFGIEFQELDKTTPSSLSQRVTNAYRKISSSARDFKPPTSTHSNNVI
ncbi:hypothetical protein [Gordonia amicalis]|uniref:hypothetical protein n=1 Tax=Gordonia amicalis TaxID=89053 RepID=UPI00387DCB79